MNLPALLDLLNRLAPLQLAEDWDNVGLLLEPSDRHEVDRVLLTIDLTESVLVEAIEKRAELVLAYHPPIFSGLKRITGESRTGRLVRALLEQRIAVYSPHTALDATAGGVNDWLGEAFGESTSRAIIDKGDGAAAPPIGQGRLLQLARPIPLSEAVERVKQHLELSHVRIASSGTAPTIGSVALCPGAGGSVVTQVRADLYLTGEMRHHDVLAAAETGTSVILTDHTNTERGYLRHYAKRLALASGGAVKTMVSEMDRDPLRVT